MSPETIDVEAARRLLADGAAVLVDVRDPDEHARERIAGSRSLPLRTLNVDALSGETRTVIFHCASGHRTHAHAARLLAAAPGAGRILSGGLAAWKRAGGPVLREEGRPIEIMRQVQIAAGSLVVVGVSLSLVSPGFLLLAAFVGFGLVVAGVTGFCGMARLLAWLPWNRASDARAPVNASSEPAD